MRFRSTAPHGYLLSQFVSPHTNLRDDQWGGSLDNRMRIVKEVCTGCRRVLGDNYPLLVKYNARDGLETGTGISEGLEIGERLADMGFDGIEVSCGLAEDGGSTFFGDSSFGGPVPQGYNRESAARLKQRINVPVFLVGGLTERSAMEEILANREAHYISLCRALIAEPNFPEKLREDRTSKSKCIQCSLCILLLSHGPVKCYFGKVPDGVSLKMP